VADKDSVLNSGGLHAGAGTNSGTHHHFGNPTGTHHLFDESIVREGFLKFFVTILKNYKK